MNLRSIWFIVDIFVLVLTFYLCFKVLKAKRGTKKIYGDREKGDVEAGLGKRGETYERTKARGGAPETKKIFFKLPWGK